MLVKHCVQTLGISDQMVLTTMYKVSVNGHISPEGRTFTSRSRKVSEDMRKRIREHIRQFPTVPSHYCRANSKKQYLAQELKLSEMYR